MLQHKIVQLQYIYYFLHRGDKYTYFQLCLTLTDPMAESEYPSILDTEGFWEEFG